MKGEPTKLGFFKDFYKNPLIITHDDLDGYGAGGILVNTLGLLGYDKEEITIINTDYTNPLPYENVNNPDIVFISDISISNSDDAEKLLAINKSAKLIIWLDHHKSSIDYTSSMYPELNIIYGIRDTRACGTKLAFLFYKYMMYHIKILELTEKTSHEDDFEHLIRCFKEYAENSLDENESDYISKWYFDLMHDTYNTKDPIPHVIKLIDDYDRFILAEPDSVYLVEAFNNDPRFIHDCKSSYLSSIVMPITMLDNKTDEYIEFGKDSYLWKRIVLLANLASGGFIAKLAINYPGIENIDFICLNTTNRGSLNFGSVLNGTNAPFNYAIAYSYTPDKFTMSVYCKNPENNKIDARTICTQLGGGGHPGAAGCVIDKIPFYDVRPLEKYHLDIINWDRISEMIKFYNREMI